MIMISVGVLRFLTIFLLACSAMLLAITCFNTSAPALASSLLEKTIPPPWRRCFHSMVRLGPTVCGARLRHRWWMATRTPNHILAGLQIWSSICALTASAVTFPQLVFFRAAEGLGETIYFPGSMSLISDYRPPEHRAMVADQCVRGTIAGVLRGKIGQVYGWRWSFIVFGGLGMALGVLLFRFLKEPRRGALEGGATARPKAGEFFKVLVRTPAALMLMFAFLLLQLRCSSAARVGCQKYSTRRVSPGPRDVGLTATLYVQLASFVLAPNTQQNGLADFWRKRTARGRIVVQLVGVICGAPFVLLCGGTTDIKLLILALTAWGFSKGLWSPNIWASLFDVVAPEYRGTAVGVMNALGWLAGGGSAPWLLGGLRRWGSAPLLGSLRASTWRPRPS